MASTAAMAARRAQAQADIERSMSDIGAALGVEVPPPVAAGLARDPAGRDAQATGRVAIFLAAVAAKVGGGGDATPPEPETHEPESPADKPNEPPAPTEPDEPTYPGDAPGDAGTGDAEPANQPGNDDEPVEPAPVEAESAESVQEDDAKDDDGAGGTADEPTFHGHPLSHFDGMDDDAVLSVRGIGPASLKAIRKAQASAKRRKSR